VKKIGIVGSGNVASHLCHILKQKEFDLLGVYSRNRQTASEICVSLSIPLIENIEELANADLIIACVSDDSLTSLIPQLSNLSPTVTTSGTVDVLKIEHTKEIGVFYPLQSFTKNKELSFEHIPIFIEASTANFANSLKEIAQIISKEVHFLSALQRQQLHLAAVLVNNFTNHLMTLAAQQLEKENLSFSWLQPLLVETVEKLDFISPYEAQTGPARRNDLKTIENHLQLITNEDLKQLYLQFTKSIQTTYSHD
jgi:predicted short-subunit dehydrogenase-like oxidoreductase (DUF2520 family)